MNIQRTQIDPLVKQKQLNKSKRPEFRGNSLDTQYYWLPINYLLITC